MVPASSSISRSEPAPSPDAAMARCERRALASSLPLLRRGLDLALRHVMAGGGRGATRPVERRRSIRVVDGDTIDVAMPDGERGDGPLHRHRHAGDGQAGHAGAVRRAAGRTPSTIGWSSGRTVTPRASTPSGATSTGGCSPTSTARAAGRAAAVRQRRARPARPRPHADDPAERLATRRSSRASRPRAGVPGRGLWGRCPL